MSPTDKAKRHLLGITIPRDELALRIGLACTGVTPPHWLSASDVLDSFNAIAGQDPRAALMGEQFRQAADAAVAYFHEQIQAGTQPQ